MAKTDFKIFKANRIGLSQMYEDAMNYVKNVYNANGQTFSMASPFAQILNVLVNLGRMILFYIETSITELNIETAYQARSIKGLSELTGHNISRGIAARGTVYMTYNNDSDYQGETIFIKNYSKIKNTANALTYIAIFPTNVLQITVGAHDSQIEIPIIQGEIKYQQATGTGEALQSFNFANKTDNVVDNFFANVYVNGKRWESVDSILDMTYEQEACIIKTSINGGIDVFFGTGNNGKIPILGSTILFEYISCQGSSGNINTEDDMNYWEWVDGGSDINGDYVDLNSIYNISSGSNVIFGTYGESIEMTRKIAPHMSRSFVLANAVNYKTFLSKLNMFSVIDVFSGFNTAEDERAEKDYNTAKDEYQDLSSRYIQQVNLDGEDSPNSRQLQEKISQKRKEMDALKITMDNSKMDDNVVYLYLVPDITKRISGSDNYFTCSLDRFSLTNDEKQGIVNLIEDSGQRVITVENRIIDPVYAKFAINVFVQMWSNYNFNSVKSSIVSAVSDYIIKSDRRDRIPVSDMIKAIEVVDGVDSVNVYFDADVNNENYFGEGNYGIDQYGDIVLSRVLTDKFGNRIDVKDVRPLFRGDFVSKNGVYYADDMNSPSGPLNITLRGRSERS